jgi:tripartite-type tricarboxylate transporter receptor subunit TctC
LRCRRTGAGDTLLVVRLDRLFIRPLVTVLVGLQRLFAPGENPAEPKSGRDLLFDAPRTSLPLVHAGSIKAYAVTSGMRLMVAPDIQTFAEMGLPALSYSAWTGLFAPKGTPRDIIDKLNAASVEALGDPAVRSRLVDLGGEIFPSEQQTPEALSTLQKADIEKWWPIIKAAGIKAE